MKKLFYLLGLIISLAVVIAACEKTTLDDNTESSMKGNNGCAKIQSGDIVYSSSHYLAGTAITTGFDDYGYNYQALKFQGSYFNSYAGGNGLPPWDGNDAAYLAVNPSAATHWAWPYRDVNLMMKWNTAWISKTDCDGDGALDRHWGFDSYIGSGAWLTNHQSGTYEVDGETCNWNYFVKIIAVPADATSSEGSGIMLMVPRSAL